MTKNAKNILTKNAKNGILLVQNKKRGVFMSYIAVKTIDYAGRIVLPKAYRTKMGLETGSKVLLQEEDGRLFVEPAEKKCRLCESNEIVADELPICKKCLEKAKKFDK